jgi:TPR repeat protein|tara:strand:+ start:100 stop:330 length:231 start_codon:yes stop_codon:yes gene_type:complete
VVTIKNYETAANFFKKSVALGYSEAQRHLALLFKNGQGVVKDYTKVRHLFNVVDLQSFNKLLREQAMPTRPPCLGE